MQRCTFHLFKRPTVARSTFLGSLKEVKSAALHIKCVPGVTKMPPKIDVRKKVTKIMPVALTFGPVLGSFSIKNVIKSQSKIDGEKNRKFHEQWNQKGTQKVTKTDLVASLPRSLDAPRVISIQATCLEPLLRSKISPQARGSRLTVHGFCGCFSHYQTNSSLPIAVLTARSMDPAALTIQINEFSLPDQ